MPEYSIAWRESCSRVPRRAPCPTAITQIAVGSPNYGSAPPFAPPCRLITSLSCARARPKLRRDSRSRPSSYSALFRLGSSRRLSERLRPHPHLLHHSGSRLLRARDDEMIVVDSPAASRVEGALVWPTNWSSGPGAPLPPPERCSRSRDSDQQRAASAIAEAKRCS